MSTTTNLKLFKHDNPTTNTNQFDVEKALNENWDKIDKNVGEMASKIQILENITSEKDTSLESEIKALKEENAIFRSQFPSATVTRKSIRLTDSSNMPCQITPLGASIQETRSGKNKIAMSKVQQTTKNGVTCTYNSDTNTITLNGECTEDNTVFHIGECKIDAVKGKTTLTGYYISGSVNERAYARLYNEGFARVLSIDLAELTSSNKRVSSTYSYEDTLLNNTRLQCYAGTIFNNLTIRLMLTDEVDTEYENYGVSPSIEYEAPIESVGDNINLFDKDDSIVENLFFNASGETESNGGAFYQESYIKVLPNTQYTISGLNKDYFRICEYTQDKTFITRQILSSQAVSFTFITSTTTEYIRISCWKTNLDSIKIEKGTKTSYSPYRLGSIEVYNCNENLYDYINNPFEGNTIGADGSESESTSGWKSTIDYIKVRNSTEITISGYKNISWKFYIAEYDKNHNFIQRTEFQMSSYSNGYTFTTTERTEFIKLYAPITQITPSEIMVNIGGITNYVEHQSQAKVLYIQQPIRSVGDVKDRFVKQNSVWYEEHNIKRMVFNGTESWGATTNGAGLEVYLLGFGARDLPKALDVKSNMLNQISDIWNISQRQNVVKISSGLNGINISIVGVTTVDELKAKLAELYNAGTPLYADYILATPILIKCTAEQVEELNSFNTYKNVTNISSDSIGELEVFYYKDLETLLGGA